MGIAVGTLSILTLKSALLPVCTNFHWSKLLTSKKLSQSCTGQCHLNISLPAAETQAAHAHSLFSTSFIMCRNVFHTNSACCKWEPSPSFVSPLIETSRWVSETKIYQISLCHFPSKHRCIFLLLIHFKCNLSDLLLTEHSICNSLLIAFHYSPYRITWHILRRTSSLRISEISQDCKWQVVSLFSIWHALYFLNHRHTQFIQSCLTTLCDFVLPHVAAQVENGMVFSSCS